MEVKFGIDNDGDFVAVVDGKPFAFYKWHDATQLSNVECVKMLDDTNAKTLWRLFQKAVEEFKQIENF